MLNYRRLFESDEIDYDNLESFAKMNESHLQNLAANAFSYQPSDHISFDINMGQGASFYDLGQGAPMQL